MPARTRFLKKNLFGNLETLALMFLEVLERRLFFE